MAPAAAALGTGVANDSAGRRIVIVDIGQFPFLLVGRKVQKRATRGWVALFVLGVVLLAASSHDVADRGLAGWIGVGEQIGKLRVDARPPALLDGQLACVGEELKERPPVALDAGLELADQPADPAGRHIDVEDVEQAVGSPD
jgi:hypothetical protein